MLCIYVAGAKPAAGYGTAVNALDDKEWAHLQTILLASLGQASTGASKRVKGAFWGRPGLKGGRAPPPFGSPQVGPEGQGQARALQDQS